MSLAGRLVVAFAAIAIVATALVGLSLRAATRRVLEAEFADRIDAAGSGVDQELRLQARQLTQVLAKRCANADLVDRALTEIARAKDDVRALDPGVGIAFREQVESEAKSFALNELYLVASDGTILGAHDVSLVGKRDPRLAALLAAPPSDTPTLRPGSSEHPIIEVHCAKSNELTRMKVGYVGALEIDQILKEVGDAFRVKLAPLREGASPPASTDAEVVRTIAFPEVKDLRLVATVSRDRLRRALEDLDRDVLLTGGIAIALAALLAVLLARTFSRPIVALARETREVVSGAPRLVEARGSRELVELAASFNRTIGELTAMRKRLAATERIAARREVARQIAHEIKNPLAPIRAAVETLRRLHDRGDEAFEGYFDEATKTVLEEVHRISNIVTEFTKFARMPAPSPAPIDLAAVARSVVALHAAPSEDDAAARVTLTSEPLPEVYADKDQMVQVLTNLVQNALDAAAAARPDPRVVVAVGPVEPEGGKKGERARFARVVVRDNGPGVSPEMVARLFEPYATTKAKGTGLGLAIVHRIVLEHGGEITYRTAKKGGAVFEITLPVDGPPLLEKAPSSG